MMSTGGGLAALHAGLIERARAPRPGEEHWAASKDASSHLDARRSEEMTRAASERRVELTPLRRIETADPEEINEAVPPLNRRSPEAPQERDVPSRPVLRPVESAPRPSTPLDGDDDISADEDYTDDAFEDEGAVEEAPLAAQSEPISYEPSADAAVPSSITAAVPAEPSTPPESVLKYAVNRKGNLLQKRRFGRRRALTVRVEDPIYQRLVAARKDMGRTSQDILETALVLYLNLLGIAESSDDNAED